MTIPCCHLYFGMGPDRSTRKKRAKLLWLEQYVGGGKKKGGWGAPLACELLTKGYLLKARKRNPRKTLTVQYDRDGAFTSPEFQRLLRKNNCKGYETPSRASDIAPIDSYVSPSASSVIMPISMRMRWMANLGTSAIMVRRSALASALSVFFSSSCIDLSSSCRISILTIVFTSNHTLRPRRPPLRLVPSCGRGVQSSMRATCTPARCRLRTACIAPGPVLGLRFPPGPR